MEMAKIRKVSRRVNALYYGSEVKRSLRANRGNDDDDLRMRDSRSMKYSQHYRNIQHDHIMNITDISVSNLLPDDVLSMDGKLEGH